MKTPKTKNVFVHKVGCLDGVAGAWVAREKFGKDLTIISTHPRQDFRVDLLHNKNVFVSGINFSVNQVKTLINNGNKVVALSLNETVAERLQEFFDGSVGKSCAVAAWELWFPDQTPPLQLMLVEDRHLWKGELSDSTDWVSGAHFYGIDEPSFRDTMNAPVSQVCETGFILNKQRENHVERLVRNAQIIKFCGYEIPIVNGPNWLASDLGNRLAKGNPFAIVYYDTKYERVYELRSCEGGVDVSKIAEGMGGGGQVRAAGFQRPKNKLIISNKPE